MRLLLDSSGPYLMAGLAASAVDAQTDDAQAGAGSGAAWQVLAEIHEPGRPPEGRDIATVVSALLQAAAAGGSKEQPADSGAAAVSAVVVGLGPGSFIGTRVAISYANGFAAAAPALRLCGVDSLSAIALAHGGLPVLRDARRGQWYLHLPARFAAGTGDPGAELRAETLVLPLPELLDRLVPLRVSEVLLEQPAAQPSQPPRRPPQRGQAPRLDPFAELEVACEAAGIALQRVEGVSAAGLALAAEQASPSEYVEPVYLRGFL